MRRYVVFAIALLIISTALFGQTEVTRFYEPQFIPQSAEIMAQGGSFNANAKGFYSLFTNPAAFGKGKASLTLVSAMPWMYALPSESTVAALETASADPAAAIGELNDILTGPGFGAGVSSGIGFVGANLGLGLIGMADVFASGPNTFGVEVDSHITFGFIGGLGIPIDLGGILLRLGGAVRPMYRIRIPNMGIDEVLSLASSDMSTGEITLPVYQGVGLGIDLAAMAEFGPFTASLSIRDLGGTVFQYTTSTFSEAMTALDAGSLPEGGPEIPENERYVIPMTWNIGAAFHPDLGGLAKLIDPVVHADYAISFVPIEVAPTFWTSLHLGAEVRLLSIFKLRAGINQGYITAGAGVHLLFLDVNVAYFGRELGSFAGAKQSQGLTAEVAIRF
jgi:hypothetical protein